MPSATIAGDGAPAAVLEDSRLRASLSPSRAGDFKTCPLLYRLRSIDRIPEPPTADQARGTLVHAVLESLFDLDAAERTPAAAAELSIRSGRRLVGESPDLAGVVTDETLAGFLTSAERPARRLLRHGGPTPARPGRARMPRDHRGR